MKAIVHLTNAVGKHLKRTEGGEFEPFVDFATKWEATLRTTLQKKLQGSMPGPVNYGVGAKAPSQEACAPVTGENNDTFPLARDSAGKPVASLKRRLEEAGLEDGASVLRQSKLRKVDGEWQVQGTLSRTDFGVVRCVGKNGVMISWGRYCLWARD